MTPKSSEIQSGCKSLDDFSETIIQQNRITLYFDLSHFSMTTSGGGVRRVVAKFVQYLAESLASNNIEVVYITGREDKSIYHALKPNGVEWDVLGPVHPARGDWYVSIDLCPEDILEHSQEISKWRREGVICFFFIHDIIFSKSPEYIDSPKKVVTLTKWLRFIVETADCLLTSSEVVKRDVVAWAKKHALDIGNTHFIIQHLGSDFVQFGEHPIKPKESEYQFLCVSTVEPRKGYDLLVPAFIHVLEQGIHARLVIVGHQGWKCDTVVRLLRTNPYAGTKIIWKDKCDDAELNRLYSESDCFVFASRDEGFGLGVMEAAQSGLQLLLRDIPIFREIAGSGALYFNEDTLESQLISIVNNPNILPSSAQIDSLTWKDSVQGMAQQIVAWIRSQISSDLKSVDRKYDAPSILNYLPRYRAPVSTLLKLSILSRWHPSKKRRQHYRARLRTSQFRHIGGNTKSCLLYLVNRFLSNYAFTSTQRESYYIEMNRILAGSR